MFSLTPDGTRACTRPVSPRSTTQHQAPSIHGDQLLAATGDDVKVVKELMRHAKISTTMEVYAQAGMEKKHVAQRRAVDVLLLDRKPKNASTEQGKNGLVPHRSRKKALLLPEISPK